MQSITMSIHLSIGGGLVRIRLSTYANFQARMLQVCDVLATDWGSAKESGMFRAIAVLVRYIEL